MEGLLLVHSEKLTPNICGPAPRGVFADIYGFEEIVQSCSPGFPAAASVGPHRLTIKTQGVQFFFAHCFQTAR